MIRSRLLKEPIQNCFDAIQKFQTVGRRGGHGEEGMYEDRGKDGSSAQMIATEARGYKIQKYNDANLTTCSTSVTSGRPAAAAGSSVGVMSRSDRHGLLKPPLPKGSKLINSQ